MGCDLPSRRQIFPWRLLSHLAFSTWRLIPGWRQRARLDFPANYERFLRRNDGGLRRFVWASTIVFFRYSTGANRTVKAAQALVLPLSEPSQKRSKRLCLGGVTGYTTPNRELQPNPTLDVWFGDSRVS